MWSSWIRGQVREKIFRKKKLQTLWKRFKGSSRREQVRKRKMMNRAKIKQVQRNQTMIIHLSKYKKVTTQKSSSANKRMKLMSWIHHKARQPMTYNDESPEMMPNCLESSILPLNRMTTSSSLRWARSRSGCKGRRCKATRPFRHRLSPQMESNLLKKLRQLKNKNRYLLIMSNWMKLIVQLSVKAQTAVKVAVLVQIRARNLNHPAVLLAKRKSRSRNSMKMMRSQMNSRNKWWQSSI